MCLYCFFNIIDIESNFLVTLSRQMKKNGKYEAFGFTHDGTNKITAIDEGSAAHKTGKIRNGDVITAIDSEIMSSGKETDDALKSAGQTIVLLLQRNLSTKGENV